VVVKIGVQPRGKCEYIALKLRDVKVESLEEHFHVKAGVETEI
jgi:hypothetical protein